MNPETNACYQCDTFTIKERMVQLDISNRGYGSLFDSCRLMVQLCADCLKPEYTKWFNEHPHCTGNTEHYQFEENIHNLINSFKIDKQERIWNGMDGFHINSLVWIGMQTETLVDDIYEEMGFYSPRQINAYNRQFPSCDHPVNVLFADGSRNCMCPMGAIGDYGQQIQNTISPSCHLCPQFSIRKKPLEEMAHEDFLDYRQFISGKLHSQRVGSSWES